MVPYNAKLWGVSATEITSRWCQRFVPKPKLDDIVAGAVGCNALGMGYNAEFLYPKSGGIQTVAAAIAKAVGMERIHLGARVKTVNAEDNWVQFEDGRKVPSINLDDVCVLIDAMGSLPPSIEDARHRLRANEVVYLNVGMMVNLARLIIGFMCGIEVAGVSGWFFQQCEPSDGSRRL